MTGAFTPQAGNVSQIAVTTAGAEAAPVLAYVGRRLKAEVGGIGPSGYSLQATGVLARVGECRRRDRAAGFRLGALTGGASMSRTGC